MNLSGRAVAELVEAHGLDASELLVFLDDVALPLGTLRIRPQGGDGGHLGLASILEVMATREVPRIRLGILPETDPDDLSDFVLEPFTKDEREIVTGVIERAHLAARMILKEGIDKAMSLYNQAPCSS
jgi:PTH1 family peptidyl-tRNA hydrolase